MLLLENCRHLATFDDAGRELEQVDVLIDGPAVKAIGPDLRQTLALAPDIPFLDASHHLVIPGLVNVHHHMWQVLTRVMPRVQNAGLFTWLVENYKVWEGVDIEAESAAAHLAMSELLLSGCTTTSDHHYLYPVGQPVELLDAEYHVAAELGMRLHATRGSMTLGVDDGGLPPMSLVESVDRVMEDYDRVVARWHDTSPFAMTRIAFAPCAPFNAREDLFRETARLARHHKVLLHTHLAETADEDVYCFEHFGRRPLDYVASLGWEGPDVWFAHCVMLNDDEIRRCAESGTGVAHCPSANARLGSGTAPIPRMLEAGVRVGMGVDGSSSNDSGSLLQEARNAFLLHRTKGGPDAVTARDCLRMATRGGAAILHNDRIGRIAEGCAADIVLIDLERYEFAGGGSLDPLATLVFCGLMRPVDTVLINGRIVVERQQVCYQSETAVVHRANAVTASLVDGARARHGVNFLVPAERR
jgi:cytosine/adenosine deaminase-related metal-dependent hydrolase